MRKTIDLQPELSNDFVAMFPLVQTDFEALYSVASDPAVWEQHPNKDRWKREVFLTFFEGAMESGGAFRIMDVATGGMAGSTRFYDYNREEDCINIGYTFYGTRYWGRGFNPAVKAMMLDYILQFVSKVYFHVGAVNKRSQIAISRLGAVKVGEQEIAYFGENAAANYIYCITGDQWNSKG